MRIDGALAGSDIGRISSGATTLCHWNQAPLRHAPGGWQGAVGESKKQKERVCNVQLAQLSR